MFKSRNNKKQDFSKVYMPQKNRDSVKRNSKRKTRGGFVFSKKVSTRRITFNNIVLKKVLLILLLVIVGVGVIYLSTLILRRVRKGENNIVVTENIIGIPGIPAFPGATFIFKNNLKESSVSNFISNGNSAYRYPFNTRIEDVYNFYQEKLPQLGWVFVTSVPVGSETMKDGEYWVKEENGLRIYSKFNDVWYELISKNDAQTGLSARVTKEIERDLLLVNDEAQDLLPDFPWVFKVPKEYVITYSASKMEGGRDLQVKKLGSEEKVTLTPIETYGGQGLDYFLDKYIDLENLQERKCGITKTILSYTEYARALKGTITCTDGKHDVAVVVNPSNRIAYVLDSNTEGNPFFETMFSNLRPQDNTRR